MQSAATLSELLAPPVPRGWPAWQARLVDAIKRRALRRLHRSARGELLLLQMYLAGEEATELALHHDLTQMEAEGRPDWVARQMAQHLVEETDHVQRFGEALQQRGGDPARLRAPDGLSRRKIAQWRELARRFAPHFGHGVLVPAYAIGLCAEQMAARVLQRHCEVLGTAHPLHALLHGVLQDERRHVRLCQHTLERLVQPQEQAQLQALLAEVRHIERAWGVTGAVGMWLAGAWLALWRPGRG